MDRRTLLKGLVALPLLSRFALPGRTRPGEPGWPTETQWAALGEKVGGRLVKVQSPFTANLLTSTNLQNPYYIDESVGLTQSLGWTDAWTSQPSAYAVLANGSADVAAAVNFAREHGVRLVVKGGGHSYIGGSNAADSLLIWTRPNMQSVELIDDFVPQGGAGLVASATAVNVGAGAIWMDAYNAVTTVGGRYVQGGGCTTVGVPGLAQGGGFGSASKGFGTAGCNLLEAEVVTADGTVRVVNEFQEPDLFWALKGGGGGTFGVVTRMTLLTHDLPDNIGPFLALVTATSDAAYEALVAQFLSFYSENLLNPHWGEQVTFASGSNGPYIYVNMVFQGLDSDQAGQTWAPFFDWVAARPSDYTVQGPGWLAVSGQDFWNEAFWESTAPTGIVPDDLPGAPSYYYYWAGDGGEVAQWWYTYQSTWLSQELLTPERQADLVDALVHAAQTFGVALHCNKGLAGAPSDALARTADTPMNPAVLDAFALAITADGQQYVYPGIANHEPDYATSRAQAKIVYAAMAPLKALRDRPAAYMWETDYFQEDWQTAFWGENYECLLRVKERYDPGGMFFIHHGVGTLLQFVGVPSRRRLAHRSLSRRARARAGSAARVPAQL
jgi:FAD/FMN-containing dehydrogenase